MNLVRRVILDTGVLVSAALRGGSVLSLAFAKALAQHEACASEATLAELENVLMRRKFNQYLDLQTRVLFIELYRKHARLFPVFGQMSHLPRPCRDPGDEIFLSLALACNADVIVSGDEDLICLSPYEGIKILRPSEFLDF